MSVDCAPQSPMRPPDWRWRRASDIIAGVGRAPSRHDDRPGGYHWIRAAVKFQRALQAATTDAMQATLATTFKDIYWAYRIARCNIRGLKDSIEAYVLARQTDFDIGYRYGIAPRIVEAYESVFFNVRDKLNHVNYVLYQTIGADFETGRLTRNTLLKLYGYFLGPHVLASMESTFVNPVWCASADSVNTAVQDDAIGTLKLKAAVAAKTLVVDSRSQIQVLDQFVKFIEVERLTDSSGSAKEQLIDHIRAMLESLPVTVAGIVPGTNRKVDRGPLAPFDKCAAELKTAEALQVVAYGTNPQLEQIKQIRFPEERSLEGPASAQ